MMKNSTNTDGMSGPLPAVYRIVVEGQLDGVLLRERRGAGGFGYDPVFVPEGQARSMAEMTLDEKNAISHRGRAARRLAGLLGLGA